MGGKKEVEILGYLYVSECKFTSEYAVWRECKDMLGMWVQTLQPRQAIPKGKCHTRWFLGSLVIMSITGRS
jgi:hypothetical protein